LLRSQDQLNNQWLARLPPRGPSLCRKELSPKDLHRKRGPSLQRAPLRHRLHDPHRLLGQRHNLAIPRKKNAADAGAT